MKNLRYNHQLFLDYMRKNNLTKTEFCKLCGINKSTLSNIFNNKNVRLISALKIADTIKTSLHSMLLH